MRAKVTLKLEPTAQGFFIVAEHGGALAGMPTMRKGPIEEHREAERQLKTYYAQLRKDIGGIVRIPDSDIDVVVETATVN